MSLVVPKSAQVIALQLFLEEDISLKLYSNDVTPDEDSVLADFTEVAGGGYAAKTIQFVDWTFAEGDPSTALAAQETWTFTGTTTAPSTVYGYYVVSAGELLWAERFAVVPFEPINTSVIKVTPRISANDVAS